VVIRGKVEGGGLERARLMMMLDTLADSNARELLILVVSSRCGWNSVGSPSKLRDVVFRYSYIIFVEVITVQVSGKLWAEN